MARCNASTCPMIPETDRGLIFFSFLRNAMRRKCEYGNQMSAMSKMYCVWNDRRWQWCRWRVVKTVCGDVAIIDCWMSDTVEDLSTDSA